MTVSKIVDTDQQGAGFGIVRVYDGSSKSDPLIAEYGRDLDPDGIPDIGTEMSFAFSDGNEDGQWDYFHDPETGEVFDDFEHNDLDNFYRGYSGDDGIVPATEDFSIIEDQSYAYEGSHYLAHTASPFSTDITSSPTDNKADLQYPVFGTNTKFQWFIRTGRYRSVNRTIINNDQFEDRQAAVINHFHDRSLNRDEKVFVRGDWFNTPSDSEDIGLDVNLPGDKWLLVEFVYNLGGRIPEFQQSGVIGRVYADVTYLPAEKANGVRPAPNDLSDAKASLKIINLDKNNVLYSSPSPTTYEGGDSRIHMVSEVPPGNDTLSNDELQIELDVQQIDENGFFDVSFGNTLESDHVHAPTPGIIEKFDGESTYPEDCDVFVNDTPLGTSFGDGTGEFEENIDISGELTKGEFNDIEITSNNLGHILAFVEGDVTRIILGNG